MPEQKAHLLRACSNGEADLFVHPFLASASLTGGDSYQEQAALSFPLQASFTYPCERNALLGSGKASGGTDLM